MLRAAERCVGEQFQDSALAKGSDQRAGLWDASLPVSVRNRRIRAGCAPCAAAFLCPLHTVLIIDPLLRTPCSHILFSLLLPSFIFSHPPPSKYQVLCKPESWKEVQRSEFKLRDMQTTLNSVIEKAHSILSIFCVSAGALVVHRVTLMGFCAPGLTFGNHFWLEASTCSSSIDVKNQRGKG